MCLRHNIMSKNYTIYFFKETKLTHTKSDLYNIIKGKEIIFGEEEITKSLIKSEWCSGSVVGP